MTAFPKGLRMAQPGDEARLFALFAMAHAENGYGDMDPAIVRAMIAKGCGREGVAIALVDGPERIEAVIGLTAQKRWYCSDHPNNWYWTELLIYVHPLHRRSRHANKLLKFTQWWSERVEMPVVIGVMSRTDITSKERLFGRFSRRVASVFMVGGVDAWPPVASES